MESLLLAWSNDSYLLFSTCAQRKKKLPLSHQFVTGAISFYNVVLYTMLCILELLLWTLDNLNFDGILQVLLQP